MAAFPPSLGMGDHIMGARSSGDPSQQRDSDPGFIYAENHSLQYSPRGGVLIC